MAVVVKAVFTSLVTKTMLDLSSLHHESTRRNLIVNEYLVTHRVSDFLVMGVKRCLRDHQDITKEQGKEGEVLGILPKHLRTSLLCEVRWQVLQLHPLFREFDPFDSKI